MYLLYKLHHESYRYFENEKYLNLDLKNKKKGWTKLNKYHHFGIVTHKSDTRGWNNADMCYPKISKNETTCQRYFNLLCKLGSVCVDINEKPPLWFSPNLNETFATLLGLHIKLLKSINVQWVSNRQKCRLLNTMYSS